jgi:hypothetical protein
MFSTRCYEHFITATLIARIIVKKHVHREVGEAIAAARDIGDDHNTLYA